MRCKERQSIIKMFYRFNKVKKILILSFILVFVNFSIFSEFSVVVFKIDANNQNRKTNLAINNAIFTFIKELKDYKVIDKRDTILPKDEKSQNKILEKYNYIFSGKILAVKNGIKLELILKDSSDDVTRTIHKVYSNSNLILLDSRVLVSSLFDMSVKLANIEEFPNEEVKEKLEKEFLPITDLASLSGTWIGEDGLKRIEIMRDAKALALILSGGIIRLNLSIDDGYLCINQIGPPLYRQFKGLPDIVAKKTAKLGKTPTWKFKISPDNKTLSGIKTDIEVKHDNVNIISSKFIKKLVTWHKK